MFWKKGIIVIMPNDWYTKWPVPISLDVMMSVEFIVTWIEDDG